MRHERHKPVPVRVFFVPVFFAVFNTTEIVNRLALPKVLILCFLRLKGGSDSPVFLHQATKAYVCLRHTSPGASVLRETAFTLKPSSGKGRLYFPITNAYIRSLLLRLTCRWDSNEDVLLR